MVESFVEKPDAAVAMELFARGGVWNSFLFAATGASVLRRYEQRLPALLEHFRAAFAGGLDGRAPRLDELYAELDTHDFSRELLQGSEANLHIEIVPPCGWTDLGTPARVEACLASVRQEPDLLLAASAPGARATFDLALAMRRKRVVRQETPAPLTA